MDTADFRRPLVVSTALIAALLAFAVGTYAMSARVSLAIPAIPTALIDVVFVIVFSLLAALLYFTARGYNWARMFLMLVVCARAASTLVRLSHHGSGSMDIVRTIIEVLAVCLLFTAPSNRWFKRLMQQA